MVNVSITVFVLFFKGGGKGGPKGGCWHCGGPHWASECPNKGGGKGGGLKYLGTLEEVKSDERWKDELFTDIPWWKKKITRSEPGRKPLFVFRK